MAGFKPHNQAMKNEEEDNKFDQRVLNIDRVSRVVKGGRRFRFRALVAIGDKKGSIGVGTAKGADVTSAINKAVEVAKKSMIKVPLQGTTIPHETMGKLGGAHILIMPASDGTGLISGSVTRDILEAAGIQNIVTKSLGNNNKINVSQAVIIALQKLVPRDKWITTLNQAANAPKAKKAAKAVAKEAA